MPYTIETEDGIEIADIPDNVTPDSPLLKRRVAEARYHATPRDSPDRQKHLQDYLSAERTRLEDEAASQGNWGSRMWANAQAGFGNLAQGAQQLGAKLGIDALAVPDEDIREKRARDAALARNTTGGGVAQVAGEVAPQLFLPGVGWAGAGVRGALAGGATMGAIGGALAPSTSDESKLGNIAEAGLLGALIPGGGSVAQSGWRTGRRILTESGAREKAAALVRDALEANAKGSTAVLPQALQQQGPRLVNVPRSAAQMTGDETLAQLEAASRAHATTQPSWAGFDARQNAAKWDALRDITPSEAALQGMEGARQGVTAPLRQTALDAATQAGGYAQPVLQHAEGLLAGDTGANPAVKSIANYVRSALGDNPTPGRLYEARKVLVDKMGGPSVIGDELSAAAKGARRETMGMVSAIDDALDAASGGQWRQYLGEYTSHSKPITSGRAMQEVGTALEGKPLVGTSNLATPQITYDAARKAMANAAPDATRFGDTLLPQTRLRSQGLLDELRGIEAPGRTRKLAGTMGGGSNTAMDTGMLSSLANKVIEMVVPGGRVLTGAVRASARINADAVQRHLAELLQQPGALGDALRALPPEGLNAVYQRVLTGSGVTTGAAIR